MTSEKCTCVIQKTALRVLQDQLLLLKFPKINLA